MISLFGNSFSSDEVVAVKKVLQSHIVGKGDYVAKFEKKFAKKIGFKHGVAVNSCTNGFWLLFSVLKDIWEDDAEVIIPNIHFFGIKNVLQLHKCRYIVADVESDVPNIALQSIKKKVTSKTKAIIFLEYGGYPLDIKDIKKYLSSIDREDILLILDAANSPFTLYENIYTATEYDVAIYSFDMNKILVTGDGGMLLSNREDLIEKIRSLSLYGIFDLNKSGFQKSQQGEGNWWELNISEPGIKLCMNNIAAAIGLVQLDKMGKILEKRSFVKNYYLEKLTTMFLPPQSAKIKNNVYFFWLMLNSEEDRNLLAKHLLKQSIYSTVKYQPLDMGADTPNAFDFYGRSLCIPLNQNLTKGNLNKIVNTINTWS
jgi:aminotransferase